MKSAECANDHPNLGSAIYEIQIMMDRIVAREFRMKINVGKSKIMTIGNELGSAHLWLKIKKFEDAKLFKDLGS